MLMICPDILSGKCKVEGKCDHSISHEENGYCYQFSMQNRFNRYTKAIGEEYLTDEEEWELFRKEMEDEESRETFGESDLCCDCVVHESFITRKDMEL